MIGKGSGPRAERSGRLLPALSAVLLALSFPPLHPLVLPFMGLVPLVVWLHSLPADGAGPGSALRGGFLFGTLYFGLLFYWVPVAIVGAGLEAGTGGGSVTGPVVFAVLAYAVIVVGLAGMAAGAVWLLHHAVRRVGAPLWVAVPVIWTALEWARAHLPSTLALPWLGLGTSLTGYPELVGAAELVGARGVTFWIATVNALLATVIIRARDGRTGDGPLNGAARKGWAGRWIGPALATSIVLVLPMAWGVRRAATLETRPVARVAIAQPDVEGRAKVVRNAPRAASRSLNATVDRTVAAVDSGEVDLVVLPEGAVRAFPRSPADSSAVLPIRRLSRTLGAPVLFGALGFSGAAAGDAVPYNSAFLMEPDGLAAFQYDKRRLVPVVERVPFLPPGWAADLDGLGAYGIGRDRSLARVAGVEYGVLICYESSYPEESRALRLTGADVLVNVTNDAWFGREPLPTRTAALWQHPAHLVMRAIEHRVGVVRSANTGISLVVDPVGRIGEGTELFTEDVRVATVRTTDVLTLYARYGDVLGNASALVALGLLLLALGSRGRGAESGAATGQGSRLS